MTRDAGQRVYRELEEENRFLPGEVEAGVEHVELVSMEEVEESPVCFPKLRVEHVVRDGRCRNRDRQETAAAPFLRNAQPRNGKRFERPGEEESLPRALQIFAGRMDERRELFDAHRTGDVAIRVDWVDDSERLRERPRGRPIQLEDDPRTPGEARLEDAAKRAVLQDEQLAQVAADPQDLRFRAVDPDSLGPRLQQADLVRLALLHAPEDVVHVERRAVEGGHPLGRVRDPVTGDDLDLEAAVPAAGVRMFGVPMRASLEDLPQGQAAFLEIRPREFRREGDEHVDLRAREVRAFRDRAREERLRLPAFRLERGEEAIQDLPDDFLDPGLLVRRRSDSSEDPFLDRKSTRLNSSHLVI